MNIHTQAVRGVAQAACRLLWYGSLEQPPQPYITQQYLGLSSQISTVCSSPLVQ